MTSPQNASASPEPKGRTPSLTQWRAVITLAVSTLIIASEMTMSAFALPLIATEFGASSAQTA